MSLARTILKNTLSNWVGMVATTIVAILMTPYILKYIGDERYGIYQIVFSVLNYLILLELGMRGSVTRFASKYIHAGEERSLNKVMSTTFVICICVGIIVIVLCVLFGLTAPRLFSISESYRAQSLTLFIGLGLSTALSFTSYAFSGILIGHYRYELQNIYLLITVAGRALFVVLFFSSGWASLTSWALATVLSSFIGLVYIVAAAYMVQKGLCIKIGLANIATVKELWGFGLWNMLMQLSGLLIISANPIIIGIFLGSEAVPYYSIPFMLVTRLQSFVRGMTATLMPYASGTLASGDKVLLRHLLYRGTYMASMLVFPVGGVLLVMCKDLFKVWLPSGYESSWVVYGILMIAFFGSITQTTSYYILLGGGDIRGTAMAYVGAGIAAVILSVCFMGYFHWGIIGGAIALVIPRFISTCIFQPWYISRQVGIGLFNYLRRSYTMPLLCTLPSLIFGAFFVYFLPPKNLLSWVCEYFVALVPFGLLALTPAMDWPMRGKLLTFLHSKIGIGNRVE